MAESMAGRRLVSATRRHGISRSQLYTWDGSHERGGWSTKATWSRPPRRPSRRWCRRRSAEAARAG
ncbi:MAG: hypothetical protein JKP98_25255 [Rhodobacteraceae bacterium]|nr:hypothetical protein [Paracoccaceae bacterium]